MRKLVCDRCGEEIDTSFMDKYDMHPSATCKIFGDDHSKINSYNEDLEYDLCKNCTNQLAEFLKSANLK